MTILYINLLPPKQHLLSWNIRAKWWWLRGTCVITMILLIMWPFLLQQKITHLTQTIATLTQEYTKIRIKSMAQSQKYPSSLCMSHAKTYSVYLKKHQEIMTAFFHSIHQGVNDGLYLTQLSFADSESQIIGIAQALSTITKLFSALITNKYFGTALTQKITHQELGYNFSWLWSYHNT